MVFDALRAVFAQERFTFGDLFLFCVLLWSACLTYAVRVYRDASDNLFGSGESASNDAYSLPSHRFSLALSFPQLSPLLWRTSQLYISHDFSRQISFLCVLCSIVEVSSFECCLEGDGEGGKRGTGGENPEGEGGLQPGCPPFLGLSPQDAGRTVLRRSSTQIIKNKSQANGHKSKPVLRVPSTQSMLECTKGNSNQSRGRWAGHVSPCRPVCTVGCSRV